MNLYYGNGDCTIEGADVRGVQIRYRGTLAITKTCGDGCLLMAGAKSIVIVSMDGKLLNNLFSYEGKLNILSVIVSDSNGERVDCTIKKVMDYSELIKSNSEDMTEIKSEDLNAGYLYKRNVRKTIVKNNMLKNQKSNGNLYLKDGTAYNGIYHIHLDTYRIMTGREHTNDSKDLYVKKRTRIVRKTQPKKTPTIMGGGGGGGGGY